MSTVLRLGPDALAGMLDDAALFPPDNAPLASALPAHADHLASWYAPLVGPFLCPASRLGELRTTLDDGPLRVAVVVDTGTGGITAALDGVRSDARLELTGVELPLRGEDLSRTAQRTVAALDDAGVTKVAAVEVPRIPGWEAALDVLAEADVRAKLRTGGATLDAVPTEGELAAFVLGCLDRELPFKLTAGLHGALRHTVPADAGPDEVPGQEQHGFLNAIAATAAALDGGSSADVASVLAERDLAPLVPLLDEASVVRARRWFPSFGTCSTTEPVEHLVALGVLVQPA